MMDVDKIPAQSLTLRFRHLAGEIRRASGHGDAEREFERLLFRVSGALWDTLNARRLPEVILRLLDGDTPTGFLSWVSREGFFYDPPTYDPREIDNQLTLNLLGYHKPYVFFEPPKLANDENCGDRSSVAFLKAGPISKVWPGVFEDICIAVSGHHPHDIGNWKSADWPWIAMCEVEAANDRVVQRIFREGVNDNRFTIMGYYATACDLLADWIEAHPDGDRDDRVTRYLAHKDGLSDDERTLSWGGGVFPIGTGSGKVIRLLVDSYHKGKPFLSQAYLMENGECYTEMRTLVKNNKLEGVLVRQKNKGGSAVKGMWGLVDPKTVSEKTTTR